MKGNRPMIIQLFYFKKADRNMSIINAAFRTDIELRVSD